MRILHLVSQTRIGGAESFALALARALRQRGHDVLLVATRHNGELFASPEAGFTCAAYPRKARFDLRLPLYLGRTIRSFRPDIIHSHNFGPNAWARLLTLQFPQIPVICHEHSGRIVTRRTASMVFDRTFSAGVRFAIGVSDEIVNVLASRRVLPAERLRMIPVGIDVDRFDVPTAPESILPQGARGRPRILHLASLIPVKNHALLLEAFAAVAARTDAVLLLAGEGPLRRTLEQRAERPDLCGRVFFLGARRDVPELLSLAAVSVLSSMAEGLPLAVLESMAAKVPPVASRVGAIPTVIDHGRSGLLVSPGSRDELARSLSELVLDPGRAAAMGAAALETVRRRYSIGAVAAEIEAVYMESLTGGSRPEHSVEWPSAR